MNAHELIEFCRNQSIELDVVDGKIKCKASRGAMTPALLEGLKLHKEEIVELLSRNAGSQESRLIARRQAQTVAASFAQQRLWFLDQFEASSAFYNMPTALRFNGHFDAAAMERALNDIAVRHEALRTTFAVVDDAPVQIIAAPSPLAFAVTDLAGLASHEREEEAQRLISKEAQTPFDLAAGPLMRAGLIRMGTEDHILLVTLHHIVSDGWSMGVLQRELTALYAAHVRRQPSPLAPLPVQYADFAQWQRQWLGADALAGQLVYWRSKLSGAPALLALPTDRPRPPLQRHRGATVTVAIPPVVTLALHDLSKQHQASLFMTLCAAFNILLARYCRQDDICIGTAIANRNRPEVESLIGFFVNTLVLRNRVDDRENFIALLQQVRTTALDAYGHQDVPFEHLVEVLELERNVSHSPLFQVMLVLQNTPPGAVELPGLTVRTADAENTISKFDLTLDITEDANRLLCAFEYDTDLFDRAGIERMAQHFGILLRAVAARPHTRIADLPMLGEAERHQLLVQWNDTAAGQPRATAMHQLFEAQAARTPDAPACLFEGSVLRYGELNEQANRLAHHLRSLGAGPESLVGICMQRSPEMIVGLFGILKAGAAYVALDPAYPKERLAYMLADAKPAVLLTQSHLDGILPDGAAPVLHLDAQQELLQGYSAVNPPCGVLADNLAYVIYTSGSTGQPKGTGITHRNACTFIDWAAATFDAASLRMVLASTSICFDLSIFEIFVPLSQGGAFHLVHNILDLCAPQASFAVSLINTVPSAIAEIARSKALPASAKVINLAGEALANSLVQTLYAEPSVERIYNLYGPTEDTTYSTYTLTEKGALASVSIGRPIANTQVYILDANLCPVPAGVAGELHIAGDGLARGYLNRPALCAEKFIPNPFGAGPGQRMYRTGDLARYLPDGNIDYLGRIDHQVKIRGFRIEPGEIEAALSALENVRTALVTVRENERGEKQLAAYLVLKVPQDGATGAIHSAMRAALLRSLPDYMVPAHFIVMDEFPLTPNGKIDRRLLPAPEAGSEAGSEVGAKLAPRTPTEEILAAIWLQVLRLETVGVGDNFFALGGHSLLATQVASKIRAAFGLELWVRILFEAPTIEELAQRIDAMRKAQAGAIGQQLAIGPQARGDILPLSFSQQRLWFLDQLEPGNAFYNMPAAVRLRGDLDEAALRRALNDIVQRHEALRTSFANTGGTPAQVVAPSLTLALPVTDLAGLPHAECEAKMQWLAQDEARTPFDLAAGPLIRASLLRLRGEEHVLLLNLHHIVSDGWSMGVLLREISVLYGAHVQGQPSPLPPLPLQYADFAHWQRQWLGGDVLQRQLDYWTGQLTDAPVLLTLPTDRPRPPVQTYRGASLRSMVPAHTTAALHALGRQSQATLFMTLCAAFNILLSRYARQEDICIGTPIANRHRAEIESLIGFFVNTLVLRAKVDAGDTFENLLRQVRTTALDAYTHQDLPFEHLVDVLQPERHADRSPLFQVMLALQNMPASDLALPGLTMQTLEVEDLTAKFDLFLNITEDDGQLSCVFEHNTDLFDTAGIARMAGHFNRLLDAIVAAPSARIGDLDMLGEEERDRLLRQWNDTAEHYPQVESLHRMFETQAKRTPHAVALVYEQSELSYQVLNARANRLARHLRALGVGQDSLVAICAERSLDMVTGLLAILKAGAAYVPLDPSYPTARLAAMLADAAPTVVLTQRHLAQSLPANGAALFLLDAQADELAAYPETNPGNAVLPSNLAYVIYTSGSTGKPKGVGIDHAGIVNRLQWMQQAYGLDASDRVLQKTPFSFDVSVWEFFWPLASGATLVMAKPGGHQDAHYLSELIAQQRITTLHFVPPMLDVFLDAFVDADAQRDYPGLRRVICSGQALPLALQQRFFGKFKHVGLHNLYGPTEASVDVTFWQCVPGSELACVPIGAPIANTQIHLLDADLNPVPAGVAGQLHIAGIGLARGYINRPELTAEKFIPNPFSAAPGARMYVSGDLARYLPDGNIEFLGRIDEQVKIRGFRIELGEIEEALSSLPGVQEAVVLARQDAREGRPSGERQLVAYVVPDLQAEGGLAGLESEQTQYWGQTFDQVYGETAGPGSTFNIVGWNSSYDRLPIPSAEMQEWVDNTVAAILALAPKNLFEIGCGTGLLLHRIAPACERYDATDLSPVVLAQLQAQLDETGSRQRNVTLFERGADDIVDLVDDSFDTVVINSVAQYFPHIDYLENVIADVIEGMGATGRIFIGDVRHFGLHAVFHASLALHHEAAHSTLAEARLALARSLRKESELLVDPAFFFALRRRFPQLRRVEVRPKLAQYENEMSKYRYDVVLSMGSAEAEAQNQPNWQDWNGVAWLERHLTTENPEHFALRNIPDARLERDVALHRQLMEGDDARTLADLQNDAAHATRFGLSPPDMSAWCASRGYRASFSAASGERGVFHAFLSRTGRAANWDSLFDTASRAMPAAFANRPLPAHLQASLQKSILERLRRQLPEYMVPAHLVVLDQMPLSRNGKTDRKALPAPDRLRDGQAYVAPRNDLERTLAKIWAETLVLDRIGITDNFFDLGGHSLLATRLLAALHRQLNRRIALTQLFASPTIAGLADAIERSDGNDSGNAYQPIAPLPAAAHYKLSHAQSRIWVFQQLNPDSSSYNMPGSMALPTNAEPHAVERLLEGIIERQASLRTVFATVDHRPVQVIVPPAPFVLSLHAAESPEALAQLAKGHAAGIFDLETGPLFRAAFVSTWDGRKLLLWNMHHIVSDGTSFDILQREILAGIALAGAGPAKAAPPALPIRYVDFAAWQETQLAIDADAGKQYWHRQLGGALPALALPYDFPAGSHRHARGAAYQFFLPGAVLERLNALANAHNATLFMVLQAGFLVLLSRITGQADLIVGTPVAGREHPDTQELIGCFINTVMLRNRVDEGESFVALLRKVKHTTLDALLHQSYPFEQLLAELGVAPDLDRFPVSPVFLNHLKFDNAGDAAGDDLRAHRELDQEMKFDLNLYVGELGGRLHFDCHYRTACFTAQTMEYIFRQYAGLLQQVAAEPSTAIAGFEVCALGAIAPPCLPDPEAHPFIEFTRDQIEQSIPARFRLQAQRWPDKIAVESAQHRLSYRELDEHATRVAAAVTQRCGSANVQVALLFEHDSAMIVGLFGALMAGKAYVPLDPAYPEARLRTMLENSRATALITNNRNLPLAQRLAGSLTESGLAIVNIDAEDVAGAYVEAAPCAPVSPDSLAYILYTSGSTGQPKGVMQNHRNALYFCMNYTNNLRIGQSDRLLLLASYSFDAAVMDIFGALLNGATLYPLDPKATEPDEMRRYINRHRVSIYHSTPTLYRHLFKDAGFMASDAMRLAVLGGELVTRDDLDTFKAAFPRGCVFINGYGPTESTLALQNFMDHDAQVTAAGIPAGRAIAGTAICLEQPGSKARAFQSGEIIIKSPHVALGYWDLPELSAKVFGIDADGNRHYRTGDIGRYRQDGSIVVLGRIDNQVKIRGFRIELGEIEAALQGHPAVAQAVVLSHASAAGDMRLVAYVVPAADAEAQAQHLRLHLKAALPDYMVPSAFVMLDALPLTPNGKIDRLALPAPDMSGKAENHVAPRSATENTLAAMWAPILGLENVGVTDNFFELGGHSLLATQLISRVRTAFNIELPVRLMFDAPTIEALAACVDQACRLQDGAPPQLERIVPVPRDTALPLSFAQQRIWFLHHFESGSAFYNIPLALHLKGTLDVAALCTALNEVVRRHETLRTTFSADDGKPLQVIAPQLTLELPVADLAALPGAERDAAARRLAQEESEALFDLATGPLIRTSLIRLDQAENILLITLHHIVSDGWSWNLLAKEISLLYAAYRQGLPSPLPALQIQYADYAHWQRQRLAGDALARHVRYWTQRLAGAPALLALPTDHPRPSLQSSNGAAVEIVLPHQTARRFKAFATSRNATLFMAMLATLEALLFKWTAQEDIVLGTVVAGRTEQSVEPLIGCFMNFLPLRNAVSADDSFLTLLARVTETVLDAYSHQDTPFEKIIEELNPERDTSHNSIFNVAFLLQNFAESALFGEGLQASILPGNRHTSALDLRFIARETSGGIELACEYNTDLFDRDTASALLDAYQGMVAAVLEQADIPLTELSVPEALQRQAERHAARNRTQTLAVAANFTAEPIEEALQFWMNKFETPSHIAFAPYNQVFQALLEPHGRFETNRHGVNLVLLRLEDWLRDAAPETDQAEHFRQALRSAGDLLAAVRNAAGRNSHAPLVVCFLPPSFSLLQRDEYCAFFDELQKRLVLELRGVAGVYPIGSEELQRLYPVADAEDHVADRLGHVPYTNEMYAAIGTLLARHAVALRARPYKVIVLDCDNTLWQGVCGESGAEGIVLTPAHLALQRFMLAQHDAGMLLCLCSKNNAQDVEAVFQLRGDMPLTQEHIVASRINWLPKSHNIRSLAAELQLGMDSFIFIDDSPVECAEVERHCAGVLVLQLPSDPENIPGFLDHVWAFDRPVVTADARQRTLQYRQNSQREAVRSEAACFEDFLSSLELQIDLHPLDAAALERAAELTQRTNQFNLRPHPRLAADMQALAQSHRCLMLDVRDRFGAYGLTGVLAYRIADQVLTLDTLLLSCRILGRGVEHRILAQLGHAALQAGCLYIELPFRDTAKNRPMRDFLESNAEQAHDPSQDGLRCFRMTVENAIALKPAPSATQGDASSATTGAAPIVQAGADAAWMRTIANELRGMAHIVSAIASAATRKIRPNPTYAAPHTPTETILATAWTELLRIDKAGIHDNFFHLGGHSLLVTQLASRVQKHFGLALSVASFFLTPTIAELALHIDASTQGQDAQQQMDEAAFSDIARQLEELAGSE